MRSPAYTVAQAAGVRVDLPGGSCWFTSQQAGDFTDPGPDRLAALAGSLGLEDRAIARSAQVHGASVRTVDGPDGAGWAEGFDGQVTASREVVCAVRAADCLPVALVAQGAVAALHAGWRGLAEGVIESGWEALSSLADGPASAVIGPGARACCYEAGPEVHEAFASLGPGARRGAMADLPWIATEKLSRLGAVEIVDCGICTICATGPRWHSHRRDGSAAGRSLGLAWRS